MFDTIMIGKTIKQARINKNMTQMNLADAMGVSYQAVSNWERGNSMPDISKLADLCAALDISVNELLGIESPAVEKALAREELTMEELAEVAPVLPPQTVMEQMEAKRKEMEQRLQEGLKQMFGPGSVFRKDVSEIAKAAVKSPESKQKKKKKLDLRRIADMAPFLDEEYLDELLESADLSDLDGLDEIAPFLSRETMEKLLERADLDDLEIIAEIAPFLSKAALDNLVTRGIGTGSVDGIEELAPFLSKETLDRVVDSVIAGNSDADLEELYPFLSKESLRKLAKYMMESHDLDALEEIIPFV